MLKIAIIGCGKIADDHLQQIRRVAGSEVVAVCDLEILMARQLAERFQVKQAFCDVGEMLTTCRPDVVHITTPPDSHLKLGMQCLEAGCHIYVEKPFTLTAADAEKLIGFAETRSRKVTAGHDLQFSPAARRMRELVRSGYLGDQPLHMESYYCYDLSDERYAKAMLGDTSHWIRRLPGKLLHNLISHGIARIAEFLPSDSPQVLTSGVTSPLLEGIGESEIIDELRVIIQDTDRVTAYFTFSSQMRPSLNLFRLFGAKNGIEVNQNHDTVIKLPGKTLTSYAEKFIPPVRFAIQQLANFATNARLFLANDFHMKSGMKHLIQSFHQSITEGSPPPISYREIILTARIMDKIFEQLGSGAAKLDSARNWIPRPPDPTAPAVVSERTKAAVANE
jgi:predicted dehydrogenase